MGGNVKSCTEGQGNPSPISSSAGNSELPAFFTCDDKQPCQCHRQQNTHMGPQSLRMNVSNYSRYESLKERDGSRPLRWQRDGTGCPEVPPTRAVSCLCIAAPTHLLYLSLTGQGFPCVPCRTTSISTYKTFREKYKTKWKKKIQDSRL